MIASWIFHHAKMSEKLNNRCTMPWSHAMVDQGEGTDPEALNGASLFPPRP